MRQPQHDPLCANRWPDDDDWEDAEHEHYETLKSGPAQAAAQTFIDNEPIEEDLPW